MNSDQVILVNEKDDQIGVMNKVRAHRSPAKLHRAASVFLFRQKKDEPERVELLLQQRSQEKIVGALEWANSVCVNLRPGESYPRAAKRRLQEELGISAEVATKILLTDIFTFRYRTECENGFGENEIDHIFAGWVSEKLDQDLMLALNPSEVKAAEWVEFAGFAQLKQKMKALGLSLAPWFELMLEDQKLEQKMLEFTSTSIDSNSYKE